MIYGVGDISIHNNNPKSFSFYDLDGLYDGIDEIIIYYNDQEFICDSDMLNFNNKWICTSQRIHDISVQKYNTFKINDNIYDLISINHDTTYCHNLKKNILIRKMIYQKIN